MDADRIIALLDTLSSTDLRCVHARAAALVAQLDDWQNPDQTERKLTYKQEYTKCNKPGCTTCSVGQGHGPYWYSYQRQGDRLVKKYIGKRKPQV